MPAKRDRRALWACWPACLKSSARRGNCCTKRRPRSCHIRRDRGAAAGWLLLAERFQRRRSKDVHPHRRARQRRRGPARPCLHVDVGGQGRVGLAQFCSRLGESSAGMNKDVENAKAIRALIQASGDVDRVFKSADKSGDGWIDAAEFRDTVHLNTLIASSLNFPCSFSSVQDRTVHSCSSLP